MAWQGQSGRCRVLLESDALILRGEVRARLGRASLGHAVAEGDDLRIATPAGLLVITLGAAAAERWAEALARPLPSLAGKLGVGPDRPALVLGEVDDPALEAALDGARTGDAARAAALVAVVTTPAALDAALDLAAAHPALPLWCIHARGRGAEPSDAAIRARLRAAGMIDTRSSAVSERLTATRYGFPKA